jgi:hypothetical protein
LQLLRAKADGGIVGDPLFPEQPLEHAMQPLHSLGLLADRNARPFGALDRMDGFGNGRRSLLQPRPVGGRGGLGNWQVAHTGGRDQLCLAKNLA